MTDHPGPEKSCACLTCRPDCSRSCRDRVCRWCRNRIDVDLTELVGLYDDLERAMERPVGHGEPVSGSRVPPVPVNLSALDLVAPGGLVADLLTWEKDWRETRGFSAGAAFRGSQRQALESVVGFLRNHLPWACEHHPAVDEFAAEIRDVVRKCHTVLGDQPRRYRLDLPCPSCDLLTLVRRDGDAYIECESVECGRLWTEHEYQRLCKILVSEIGEAS